MKIVAVTTAADTFGGVFARAYRQAGGPAPDLTVLLPPRPELGFRTLGERVLAAWKLGRPATARDRAYGLHLPWVDTLAEGGSEVVEVEKIGAPETLALLRRAAPDLLLSLGAPVIFPARVLEVPRIGAVNVHNGRLPQYRGHFGTFWEVARGEAVSYTSIHAMTAKVDAGELLAAEGCRVTGCGSFLELMLEKKRAGGRLLAEVVRHVAQTGALTPLPGRVPPPVGSPGAHYSFPGVAELRAFSFPRAVAR
ncbi:MAG TPA: formyltransferase family protein [Longimicrobium sp.]